MEKYMKSVSRPKQINLGLAWIKNEHVIVRSNYFENFSMKLVSYFLHFSVMCIEHSNRDHATSSKRGRSERFTT